MPPAASRLTGPRPLQQCCKSEIGQYDPASKRQERGRSSGVEHNLAKVGVEGSNPFARSRFSMFGIESNCFPGAVIFFGEAGGKLLAGNRADWTRWGISLVVAILSII